MSIVVMHPHTQGNLLNGNSILVPPCYGTSEHGDDIRSIFRPSSAPTMCASVRTGVLNVSQDAFKARPGNHGLK